MWVWLVRTLIFQESFSSTLEHQRLCLVEFHQLHYTKECLQHTHHSLYIEPTSQY